MSSLKARVGLVLAVGVLLVGAGSLGAGPVVAGATAATSSSAIAPATDPVAPTAGALVGGATLELQVGGVAGVPMDASAAVMNVTVTNPVGSGFVTVWPCGEARPLASNLNYVAGENVPNLTISKLGTSGKVCFFSMVATDLVADVAGFFPAGSDYTPVTNPTRILDTRDGTGAPAADVATGATLELQVGGVAGVPMDASAVVMNVTVTNPVGSGFVTVWPCGEARPLASNLNYVAGENVPNLTISKLGTSGKVCFFSMVATDLVADVAGFFPAGSDYTPVTNPTRILDTRDGTGAPAADVATGATLELQVGGVAGVPMDASAAVMNVTVTNPVGSGFVTVWPCGEARPLASNLNYVAGENVPNLTISKLGTSGKVCFFSMVATDLVADVAGFFPAGSDYTPVTNPTRILDTRDGTGTNPAGGTPGSGPTAPPGGGASSCSFSKADVPVSVALCDSFDVAEGDPARRSGDLEPILWGVSRTNTIVNPGQGENNIWSAASLVGCGATVQVLPPKDVRICGGRLFDAVADNGGQSTLAMYPKQPFDISGGRTGTVVFDVSADSHGPHAAWPEFWWTDQPVPAPHGHMSAQAPYARNSFGFSVAQQCAGGQVGVDKMMVTRNYTLAELQFSQTGCVNKGSPTGGLNHFEVRINQNRVEVWASDPGSTVVRQIAVATNANITMVKGVAWIEDVHYNACKEPGDTQCDHTFAWDNFGFDGPKTYRDLSYDVPDATTSGSGSADLGYSLNASGRGFTINNVTWQQPPTGALVTFNWYAMAQSVPSVRVNGGAWHDTAWPFDSETFVWRTIVVPIDMSEVHSGTNTVELKSGDSTSIANINLILIAGAPVP